MAKKVFRDYAEVNGKLLEGFTVAEVLTGVNAEGSGMLIGLERTIDNVTIGVDVVYNPICTEDETPLMFSQEYVKNIDEIPEEQKKGIKITSALENSNGSWPTIRAWNGKGQP